MRPRRPRFGAGASPGGVGPGGRRGGRADGRGGRHVARPAHRGLARLVGGGWRSGLAHVGDSVGRFVSRFVSR